MRPPSHPRPLPTAPCQSNLHPRVPRLPSGPPFSFTVASSWRQSMSSFPSPALRTPGRPHGAQHAFSNDAAFVPENLRPGTQQSPWHKAKWRGPVRGQRTFYEEMWGVGVPGGLGKPRYSQIHRLLLSIPGIGFGGHKGSNSPGPAPVGSLFVSANTLIHVMCPALWALRWPAPVHLPDSHPGGQQILS